MMIRSGTVAHEGRTRVGLGSPFDRLAAADLLFTRDEHCLLVMLVSKKSRGGGGVTASLFILLRSGERTVSID